MKSSRNIWIPLTIFIFLIMLAGSFSAGILLGRYAQLPVVATITKSTAIPTSQGSASDQEKTEASVSTKVPELTQTSSTVEDQQALFVPFWEAWNLVHDQFVDQPVDDRALMHGAIEGMLKSLGDEHTSYMDPDSYMQANMSLEGSYEGIGAWVDTDGEYLTIISPMPDSPAEKAGLKAGDQVIAIDGQDMTGIDGNLVIRKVLGPSGTKVELTIRREGESSHLIFMVDRAKILLPSVESRMLDNKIAYVRLYSFGDNTTPDLRKALRSLLREDPRGLILDLRYNGGGYLASAIEVSSEFISDGVALFEIFGSGEQVTHKILPGGLATKIPLVVLVNEGTASASEIVAGAIQDYERGKLVGVKTYGKGSVQNWTELSNNEGAVRITAARWLTPNQRLIHKVGLTPDFVVEQTKDDIENDRDPQLDKAIEVLLTMP